MATIHRRANIVCTLGPASSSPEALRALIRAGMNVARINFSHGEWADHERTDSRPRYRCLERFFSFCFPFYPWSGCWFWPV